MRLHRALLPALIAPALVTGCALPTINVGTSDNSPSTTKPSSSATASASVSESTASAESTPATNSSSPSASPASSAPAASGDTQAVVADGEGTYIIGGKDSVEAMWHDRNAARTWRGVLRVDKYTVRPVQSGWAVEVHWRHTLLDAGKLFETEHMGRVIGPHMLYPAGVKEWSKTLNETDTCNSRNTDARQVGVEDTGCFVGLVEASAVPAIEARLINGTVVGTFTPTEKQ